MAQGHKGTMAQGRKGGGIRGVRSEGSERRAKGTELLPATSLIEGRIVRAEIRTGCNLN